MIRSFRCKDTQRLLDDWDVARFRAIEPVARRKLLYLHRAARLDDLRVPPGSRLELLKGARAGQYSIRTTINDVSASGGTTVMCLTSRSSITTEVIS